MKAGTLKRGLMATSNGANSGSGGDSHAQYTP
jgi:hypothetical protein